MARVIEARRKKWQCPKCDEPSDPQKEKLLGQRARHGPQKGDTTGLLLDFLNAIPPN
jgi:hypothetical protein